MLPCSCPVHKIRRWSTLVLWLLFFNCAGLQYCKTKLLVNVLSSKINVTTPPKMQHLYQFIMHIWNWSHETFNTFQNIIHVEKQLWTTTFHYITSLSRNIHNFVWKFKDATKISSDSEMSSMYVCFGRNDGMINSAGTVEIEIQKVTRGGNPRLSLVTITATSTLEAKFRRTWYHSWHWTVTSPNVNICTIYDCQYSEVWGELCGGKRSGSPARDMVTITRRWSTASPS